MTALIAVAPVAIAVESMKAGRRRRDLRVTGLDLDSGERVTVRVKSLGPWTPQPAPTMSDGLVLVLSLEHPLTPR